MVTNPRNLVMMPRALVLGSCLLSLASSLRVGPALLPRQLPHCRPAVLVMQDGVDATEEADKLLADADGKMVKSIKSVQEQLSTLRVGRATPSLLDRVQVNYYDTETPLNQLASITTPTPTQLVIDAYDKSAIGEIEKALMMSDLGMTPSNDGKVIRLNVPQLTQERRKVNALRPDPSSVTPGSCHPSTFLVYYIPFRSQPSPFCSVPNLPQLTPHHPSPLQELAKTAKSLGEDGKVSLRNIRKDVQKKMKKIVRLAIAASGEECGGVGVPKCRTYQRGGVWEGVTRPTSTTPPTSTPPGPPPSL